MRPKLFIECTHTTEFGLQTGVQRVVRSLCRQGFKAGYPPFAKIVPVVINEFGPQSVPYERLLAPEPTHGQSPGRLRSKLNKVLRRLSQKGKRFTQGFGPKLANIGASKTSGSVELNAGDVLLLPDAYWANQAVWPWASDQKSKGVLLAVVVYDLIPHLYPDEFGAQGVELFREYVRSVARHADIILTISETVAIDVRREVPLLTPEWNPQTPVVSFPLGAEFGACRGSVRPAIQTCFDVEPSKAPLLMVGTIDSRKNHGYALDAMELMWQKNVDVSLCIMGEVGWSGGDFVERARAHREFGARLKMFHGVNDRELRHAYSNSRGVLFTSSYEGYGLPIVESLYHGKPTFVTDTPIHREVGGEHVVYCDIGNPQHMADQIANYSWEPQKNASVQPCTWKNSLGRIVAILDEHCPTSARRAA